MNPLLPTGGEIFISLIGILHALLFIVALIRVGFDKWLKPEHKVLLLLFSLLIPVIGPAMSLFVTFRTSKK